MINNITANDFESVYKIMEQSFPRSEIRAKQDQERLFENEHYHILGIECDDSLRCFAAVWEFEDFIFVEHLATAPEFRNRGLGGKILRQIISDTAKTVCLEVEPPASEITRRRVAFYERNGMFFNSYAYIQPSLGKGREAIPLYIMTSKSKIDENTFNKIRNTLYTEVYGAKAID